MIHGENRALHRDQAIIGRNVQTARALFGCLHDHLPAIQMNRRTLPGASDRNIRTLAHLDQGAVEQPHYRRGTFRGADLVSVPISYPAGISRTSVPEPV